MANNYWRGTLSNVWQTAGNWSLGAVPTSSDGNTAVFDGTSPNCTLNAGGVLNCVNIDFSAYANTITVNNSLNLYGNITLGPNAHYAYSGANVLLCRGTAPTLYGNNCTLDLPWSDAGPGINKTLAGGGNFTISKPIVFNTGAVNNTTSEQLISTGNITNASALLSGTGTLVVSGGIMTLPGTTITNLIISGSPTIASLAISGSTILTCTSGTPSVGTTTLTVGGSTTLNCPNLIFYNLNVVSTGTITLNALVIVSNNLSLNNSAVTFAGAYGFTTSNLIHNVVGTTSGINTFKAGNTYTVTGSLLAYGADSSHHLTWKSDNAGSPFYLTLTPEVSSIISIYINATDIDSSRGQTVNQYGGVISASTLNWNTLTTFQIPQDPFASFT